MLQIAPMQSEFGAMMLAQVHDELVWQVPIDVTDEFAELASKKMEQAGEEFGLRVKLIAEPGVGPNWAEAK
jgi:DNA polymerase I-like protein with 3'-5' exonuclease and polymerase domains